MELKSPTAFLTKSWTLAVFEMSTAPAWAFLPILPAAFSALARWREQAMTVVPLAASSLAISKPMPLVAPVTTATLPFNPEW